MFVPTSHFWLHRGKKDPRTKGVVTPKVPANSLFAGSKSMTPQRYSDWAMFFFLKLRGIRCWRMDCGWWISLIPTRRRLALLVLRGPQRSPSPLAAGPEAAVAVAVTVGSFSDPEAAEGKRVRKAGDSLIHRKKPWVFEKRFLRSQIFLSAFFWQWNVFLFERSPWKHFSGRSLMAWLICWSIPCFWVPRTFQRGALRKDGKEWDLENSFFVEDVVCTNEMDDFHWSCATGNVLLRPEEYAIITTWRNSYLRPTHHISIEKIQRSKFFSFKVLLKSFETIEFLQLFFFPLGKRSGCFCWLRFFFGRSGFDAWLAQNGGGSNAYTAEEQTVFYASVSGKAVSFWLGA